MPTNVGGAGAGAAGATRGSAGAAGLGMTTELPIAGAGATGADAMAGAGAAGSGTTTSPVVSTECIPPPLDAPDVAVQALDIVNEARLAAGAGCMKLIDQLVQSAQSHCDYVAAHPNDASCRSTGHDEVMGCSGFTGTTAQAREIAAGYPQALAYTEVFLSYGNDPVASIPGWIDTVWHRIPLLDPWTVDMGWGGAAGCDVIDIGRGMSTAPADAVAVYPYDGQVGVPPSFSGLEAPAPPPPAGGWPSAYPINIYAQGISVTEHVLTKDGDTTPIGHLWLDAKSPEVSAGLKGYFKNTAFMYGAPFDANTKYHVKIAGTHTGGALNIEWSFTTGTTRPFGG